MTTRCMVKCYSGGSYAQHPTSFFWEGTEYDVSEVIKEGFTPRGKHFLVCTPEGLWFNLEYKIEVDQWQVCQGYQSETPRRSF